MKSIGLIGGMSWESTAHYYEDLNKGIKERLGGLHSAHLVMESVDFAPIEALMRKEEWESIGEILASSALRLEKAGAQAIVLCTNTMHKLAPLIEEVTLIPLLHIAHITAEEICKEGIDEVLLLGTRFTMQQDFYKNTLAQKGLRVRIPNGKACEEIDRIIFEELCVGNILESSKQTYLSIIKDILKQYPHTKGVIFGCTEIGMLLSQEDTSLKTFDTTALHVKAILDFMLD